MASADEDPPSGSKERLLLVGAVLVVVVAVAFLPFGAITDWFRHRDAVARHPASTGVTVPTFHAVADPTQSALLDDAVGFGGGVTGGAGGSVVHVRSAADSGPGSLRAAAAGDGPRWVVFDRDLTIRLRSPIRVSSNTTIDGRGHRVVLTSDGRQTTGLQVDTVHNVVIESLTLRSFGVLHPTGGVKDHSREVLVDNAVGVWIDHNDLSRSGDKAIAVQGSRGVTVSWNHVHDQREVMQVGEQTRRGESVATTVTVHHNFFDHDYFKMPEVSYARVHVFNNYYLDWGEVAVRSARTAQVFLERNVFDGVRSRVLGRFAAKTNAPNKSGCNATLTACDGRSGYLRAIGNRVSGEPEPDSRSPSRVFDPKDVYRYSAAPADDALVASVTAGAGPR